VLIRSRRPASHVDVASYRYLLDADRPFMNPTIRRFTSATSAIQVRVPVSVGLSVSVVVMARTGQGW
jgi:hypothetical protein